MTFATLFDPALIWRPDSGVDRAAHGPPATNHLRALPVWGSTSAAGHTAQPVALGTMIWATSPRTTSAVVTDGVPPMGDSAVGGDFLRVAARLFGLLERTPPHSTELSGLASGGSAVRRRDRVET